MKNLFPYFVGAAIALVFVGMFAFSVTPRVVQENGGKKAHRVVFQITTPDTAAYRSLTRQITHVLEGLPNARIEVVVHNKGIAMLQTQKSNVAPELQALAGQGVQFMACEQTLKIQKLQKSDILPLAGFVPRGLVEIIEKQDEGWAYIKGGF
ncbi:MAG TPA: DsrE family protein [Saprospiraceae bacterium]|nr:DsrE family protein [Saprospiraceae bacterium]